MRPCNRHYTVHTLGMGIVCFSRHVMVSDTWVQSNQMAKAERKRCSWVKLIGRRRYYRLLRVVSRLCAYSSSFPSHSVHAQGRKGIIQQKKMMFGMEDFLLARRFVEKETPCTATWQRVQASLAFAHIQLSIPQKRPDIVCLR